MVFARRDRRPLAASLREAILPARGWGRRLRYLRHRILRLNDSPHRIAAGFSAGVFIAFGPFFGIDMLLAAALAWAIRGNLFTALLGTLVGNPLTLPLVATASFGAGERILGRTGPETDFDAILLAFDTAWASTLATVAGWFGWEPTPLDRLLGFLDAMFLPYLVGGATLGGLAALLAYPAARLAVHLLRRRKAVAKPADPR